MLWQVMRCLLDHAALCCRYLTCCSSVPLWWRPNQLTVSGASNCNAYLAPAEPLLNVSQESWASGGSEDLSPWERKRTMKGQRWSNKIQLHQHILNCQLYKCAKKRNAYLYMFLHVLFNGFRPVVTDPLAQWDSQLYLWWSAHLCPKWP